jgi:hypothetical protein
MSVRRLICAAAFCAVVLVGRFAFAQTRVDVEKARAAYLARNYADAEARLRVLVDPQMGLKETALMSQARMYLGAALIAQNQPEEAVTIFEKLIREDSSFDPDPLSFPSDVINKFFDTRERLQEEIRQNAMNVARSEAAKRVKAEEDRRKQEAWLAKVKQMATEEKITVHHDRRVAFLPFGIGQFQNGDPILGWTFLVTEAALLVGTGVTVPMYAYARSHAEDESRSGNLAGKAQLYQDRADNIVTVNLSFVGALAAVAVGGIVQANLAYVPETVEIKKHELPPVGSVKPVVSPSFVGLTGTF